MIRIVLIAIDVAPVERRATTDPKPESGASAGLLFLLLDRRVPANILLDWGIVKTEVDMKLTPNFGCDQRYSLTYRLRLPINLYIFANFGLILDFFRWDEIGLVFSFSILKLFTSKCCPKSQLIWTIWTKAPQTQSAFWPWNLVWNGPTGSKIVPSCQCWFFF